MEETTVRQALEAHALDLARQTWPDKEPADPRDLMVEKLERLALLPWHIVRRVGKSDEHAIEWLTRLGLETYYPMVREMRPVPRDKLSKKQRASAVSIMRPRLVPFFPAYIFVRMQLEGMDWRSLKEITGVGGLACEGNLPIQVPNELIEAIREREIGGAVPGKTPAKLIFSLGQKVRVTEGAFMGFIAEVEKLPNAAIQDIDSGTRIRVAVEVFGRPTPVDLPISHIEKT